MKKFKNGWSKNLQGTLAFVNIAKFQLAIILLSCYYHIKRVKENYLNADSKTFLFFILVHLLRMLINRYRRWRFVNFAFSRNSVVIETTLSRQSDFKISRTLRSQIGLCVVQFSCFWVLPFQLSAEQLQLKTRRKLDTCNVNTNWKFPSVSELLSARSLPQAASKNFTPMLCEGAVASHTPF